MSGAGTDADLLGRAAGGDAAALAELFERYRERLARLVRHRLDRRLSGRLGVDDVLQEAFIDMSRELPRYMAGSELPFFLWLRLVTAQRLMRIHRQHLGVAMRDAGREVNPGGAPESSVPAMAEDLVGRLTTVSQVVLRNERRDLLRDALQEMDPIDRETIVLRHFEGLGNGEVATVLGLTKTAASNRYVRAMARLQEALAKVPGLVDMT